MAILCSVLGHVAMADRHCNQGLEFALCHHCGCDLIRSEGEADWAPVPAGFRVVWREFGRAGDAASVAQRMARMAEPARRDLRSLQAAPRRAPRKRPIRGATAMVGTLVNLRHLVAADEMADRSGVESSGQYVICLPASGVH
ncbi:hypothetical protein ACG3SL_05690 [Sphingomonas sp. CJ20]